MKMGSNVEKNESIDLKCRRGPKLVLHRSEYNNVKGRRIILEGYVLSVDTCIKK